MILEINGNMTNIGLMEKYYEFLILNLKSNENTWEFFLNDMIILKMKKNKRKNGIFNVTYKDITKNITTIDKWNIMKMQ